MPGLYPRSISLILFQTFFNFLQSLIGLFLRQSLKGHPEVMILLPQLLEFRDYTGTTGPGFLRILLLLVEVVLIDLCFKLILNPQTFNNQHKYVDGLVLFWSYPKLSSVFIFLKMRILWQRELRCKGFQREGALGSIMSVSLFCGRESSEAEGQWGGQWRGHQQWERSREQWGGERGQLRRVWRRVLRSLLWRIIFTSVCHANENIKERATAQRGCGFFDMEFTWSALLVWAPCSVFRLRPRHVT